MQENLQNKKDLVKNVFNQVYNNYDLMNDLMSFGVHRIWKKNLINMMNPSKNHKLIDVACGTGDIVELYIKNVGKFSNITCVDPNERMIKKAKEKLTKFKKVSSNLSQFLIIISVNISTFFLLLSISSVLIIKSDKE